MADFEQVVKLTLKREGGSRLTNDPDDPGGVTKYGISKRSFPDVDVKNLNEDSAKEIYKEHYWDRVGGDFFTSQAISEKLFDTAVNMGVRASARLAQKTVGAKADGIIGPETRLAIQLTNEESFLMGFTLLQIALYCGIARKRPKSKKFLLGWITRALGDK